MDFTDFKEGTPLFIVINKQQEEISHISSILEISSKGVFLRVPLTSEGKFPFKRKDLLTLKIYQYDKEYIFRIKSWCKDKRPIIPRMRIKRVEIIGVYRLPIQLY